MRQSIAILWVLVAVAFGMPRVADAVLYSAVDDFSGTVNTVSSTWSYRSAGDLVRDGSYDLLTVFESYTLWDPDTPIWKPTAGDPAPGIGVNDTGSAIPAETVPAWSWADGTIWMHPDPSNLVVVSWLAPDAGTVDIDFSFSDMDPNGGNGVNWFVDLGSSAGNLASGVLANGASSGAQSVLGQAVSAGERVHFIVDPIGANHSFDSTAFTGTVDFTAVPEPSRVVLGLMGAVAIALLRRR